MPSEAYAPGGRAGAATIEPMRRNASTVVVLAGPGARRGPGRPRPVHERGPVRPERHGLERPSSPREPRAWRPPRRRCSGPAGPRHPMPWCPPIRSRRWPRAGARCGTCRGRRVRPPSSRRRSRPWPRGGRGGSSCRITTWCSSARAPEGPDFYLGPLRSARAHRVVLVPEQEPAQQAAGVLHALGSLRHGPWWPGLDEVIEVARRFYPDSLAEGSATALGPATPEAGRVRAG